MSRDLSPQLKIELSPPIAVRDAPRPDGAKISWFLQAAYPSPEGTVYLRRGESDRSGAFLEVLTPSGVLLQRVRTDPSLGDTPPPVAEARYLEPAHRRGPLLYLRSPDWHYLYAFPKGFAGFLSENSVPSSETLRWETDRRGWTALQVGKTRRFWRGVEFVAGVEGENHPAISEGTMPARLPLPPTKGETRFAAVSFDRVYFLRWVAQGRQRILEVWDETGHRRIARHLLHDEFGASPRFTFLNVEWLDEKRRRDPVLIVRDSDQVRVHVFRDGLTTLLAAQDFNDSSSSLAATTVSFGRDKHGLLTVTESYSERGDGDGSSGASRETNYRWTGKAFTP